MFLRPRYQNSTFFFSFSLLSSSSAGVEEMLAENMPRAMMSVGLVSMIFIFEVHRGDVRGFLRAGKLDRGAF